MADATQNEAGYPLAGLKVLDFSRVLAGPFAGRMLSDLGADVVKVEPPDGDVTRQWGRVVAGLPGYYFQQNAGKRNISIDLRAPGARELVLALARHADVLIENYRPDVMPRLGLGWDDLHAANPRLIMLSISGFGQGGPESHRAAYAPIVHAETGLMERAQRRSGGLPRRDLPLSVADTNAALHGLVGLLSAVIMRGRTGIGQHVDIAMVDATIATDDQLQYDLDGIRRHRAAAQRHLGDRRRSDPGLRRLPLHLAAADEPARGPRGFRRRTWPPRSRRGARRWRRSCCR